MHVRLRDFQADDAIKSEMFVILKHDVEEHPVDDISLEDLEKSKKMIQNELKPVCMKSNIKQINVVSLLLFFNINVGILFQEERTCLNSNLWAVIEQCSSELILAQNKFTRLGVLPKKDQIDALSAKFQVEYFFVLFFIMIRILLQNFCISFALIAHFIALSRLDEYSCKKNRKNGEEIEGETGWLSGISSKFASELTLIYFHSTI